MAISKKDQLVETALRLFNEQGFHATGIDTILQAAGVAKMTLYNHFKSKDELILAALRRCDETFRNNFMRDVEKRSKKPVGRLLAVFDVLGDWFKCDDFCGCTFINASAEFSEPHSPIHVACHEHKRIVMSYIQQLTEQAGAADPPLLARQLCLLMEGAIVHASVSGDARWARDAKKTAKILIDDGMKE